MNGGKQEVEEQLVDIYMATLFYFFYRISYHDPGSSLELCFSIQKWSILNYIQYNFIQKMSNSFQTLDPSEKDRGNAVRR